MRCFSLFVVSLSLACFSDTNDSSSSGGGQTTGTGDLSDGGSTGSSPGESGGTDDTGATGGDGGETTETGATGPGSSDPGSSTSSETGLLCGNGIVDEGEECDGDPPSVCDSDCSLVVHECNIVTNAGCDAGVDPPEGCTLPTDTNVTKCSVLLGTWAYEDDQCGFGGNPECHENLMCSDYDGFSFRCYRACYVSDPPQGCTCVSATDSPPNLTDAPADWGFCAP